MAFVAAVMLAGTVWPGAGLFKLVYARLLKPAGILRPDVMEDDPAPHLFAQGLGGLVLGAATLALAAGVSVLGWALADRARVAVYAVDAVAHEELARFYGIMTVPSTVLLNARLQPVAINHGFAPEDRLAQQLHAAGS